MKVQCVRLSDDSVAWMVLDDDHTPVQPILSYLKYLHTLDRSPNTIRATAHRLKLFWEYLRDEHLSWKEIDVARLAAFISWLRRPDPTLMSKILPNGPLAKDAPSTYWIEMIWWTIAYIDVSFVFLLWKKNSPVFTWEDK